MENKINTEVVAHLQDGPGISQVMMEDFVKEAKKIKNDANLVGTTFKVDVDNFRDQPSKESNKNKIK